VVLAIAVVLTVCLIVFLVVRDEVSEGEPVVGSDEVDAGDRAPGVGLVEVGASCISFCAFTCSVSSSPFFSRRIAKPRGVFTSSASWPSPR
jgi:hypothetical protein